MSPRPRGATRLPSAGCGLTSLLLLLLAPVGWWLFTGEISRRRGHRMSVLASLEREPEAYWTYILGALALVILLTLTFICFSKKRR